MTANISRRQLLLHFSKTQEETFQALQDLKSAFLKMKYKQPLSNTERYAVYALWHEIWHLKAKKGFVSTPPMGVRLLMESLNDYLAQKSFKDFLKSFDQTYDQKWEKIASGYPKHVKNLVKLLELAGLTKVSELQKILLDDYDEISYTLIRKIGKKMQLKEKDMIALQFLIENYFHKPDQFEKRFEKWFASLKTKP